jgi:hypothetical protein
MAIHPAEPATRLAAASPSDIARRWVGLLEVGDVEAALSLYSPNARVHTRVAKFAGYEGVRLYLAQLPLIGWRPSHVEFHAAQDGLVILWSPAVPGCPYGLGAMSRMRIEDGRIAEQWMISS